MAGFGLNSEFAHFAYCSESKVNKKELIVLQKVEKSDVWKKYNCDLYLKKHYKYFLSISHTIGALIINYGLSIG